MESPSHGNQPLSPVMLAGLMFSPLPPAMLQPFLNAAMTMMCRRHPGLFDRLAGLGDATFLIDPIDLPFGFLLRPSPPPSLVAVAKEAPTKTPTATVRSSLSTLIRLLEGKLDGDAVFFSRDLVVEGNTEAVVTLRNAIDGAGIDLLEDLLSELGPLAGPAGRLAGGAIAVLSRINRDIGFLGRAFLAPINDRIDAQAAGLRGLRDYVAEPSGRGGSGLRARRSRPRGISVK